MTADPIARLRELLAKATPGEWCWQGEDYRGGWGWQLLVNDKGEGIACGESHDGGPYKHLKAYVPIDPKLCKTGMLADDESAPCLHIRQPDADLLIAAHNALPALLDALEAAKAMRHAYEPGGDEEHAAWLAFDAAYAKLTKEE